MVYIIIGIILITYILFLIRNIYMLIHKQNLYDAIKNKKILKLSSKKFIDFKNDYDFIKFLILSESVEIGIDNILSKPSEKAKLYANIMLKQNIENHKEFIDKEKKNVLNKILKSKKYIIVNIISSFLVIFSFFVIFFC